METKQKNTTEIKITFISHSSGIGGAEKSMLELIDGLVKKGVNCNVLIPSEGSLSKELKTRNLNFDIIYLPWCGEEEKLYSPERTNEIAKSVIDILYLLEKDIPDIIYSNSSVILQGAMVARILGVKHIWHIREFGERDYGINFYLPINQRAEFIFNNSDKIIFISKSLMDYYHKYIPKNKSELIYNNVKIEEPKDIIIEKEKDSRLKEGLKLLMIGNIHPAKGQMDAVKALKLLNNKGIKNLKLTIVGSKNLEYYREIVNFIKLNNLIDQINIIEKVENPALFYKETDVLLMCSRSEGFGRVTVESMLFGKPVIGSNSGGTPEIIEDGINGLLYQSGNINDLSEKILFFYKNKKKVLEYGERGKLFCKNNFSDEKYVNKIYEIILEMKKKRDVLIEELFLSVIEENISRINKLISDIDYKKQILFKQKKQIQKKETEIKIERNKLEEIYSSRGWKLILLARKFSYKLFPNEIFRRKIIVVVFGILKRIGKFVKKFIDKMISLPLIIKNYFLKFKPKEKRKINLNSKKILFVGHSFHLKTKSSDFLIDYLKKFYEVEIMFDSSWEDGKQIDFSFVDDSYLGVIFWQLLPDSKIIKSIKNENIIFFPMYDQSGDLRVNYWNNYRNLKIINFSKALHDKLKKWGFESMYIQYFPEPKEFNPGKKDGVFFWQRIEELNINHILKLFNKKEVKIHLHNAVDPWRRFVEPTREQEKDFNITYSEWFDSKEEMLNVIKQKGIYIAPRIKEGIGMSFLEAMAMGKAVIAVDNPTMNEYIIDGETGYLFDLNNPKKIDLDKIEDVQKNVYKYICAGYEKWEKEKDKIIKFIKNA